MKAWICTTLASFFGPMQGAARLYAYLKKQGHNVSLKDFNQDAYFALLSREYLEHNLEKAQFVLEPLKRNKFLREDMGAILLHSSNNAIKQLLVKGILLGSPWHRFIKASPLVERPISSVIQAKIGADNVIYALLAEKEYILSEVESGLAKFLIGKFLVLRHMNLWPILIRSYAGRP